MQDQRARVTGKMNISALLHIRVRLQKYAVGMVYSILGLPHSWACFIVIRIYDLPYSCSTIVDPLFHLKECAVYLPESGP